MMGGRALLIVNGQAPKPVAVGDSFQGVKVVSTQGELAVVEMAGQRQTLKVGEALQRGANASAAGGEGGSTIVPPPARAGTFHPRPNQWQIRAHGRTGHRRHDDSHERDRSPALGINYQRAKPYA